MANEPNNRIVVLGGSPSQPSRTTALAEQVARDLQALGFAAERIALRDLPAGDLLRGEASAPGVKEAVDSVTRAAGIVLATPIYKAAYSGLLKVFLDLLPQFAFEGKTLLPLATGGSLAHVLAIDYALRPVLSALGARHVVAGFFVLDKQFESTPEGLRLDAETREKLAGIVSAFVDSLHRHAL